MVGLIALVCALLLSLWVGAVCLAPVRGWILVNCPPQWMPVAVFVNKALFFAGIVLTFWLLSSPIRWAVVAITGRDPWIRANSTVSSKYMG
jgi:hypothetical protein